MIIRRTIHRFQFVSAQISGVCNNKPYIPYGVGTGKLVAVEARGAYRAYKGNETHRSSQQQNSIYIYIYEEDTQTRTAVTQHCLLLFFMKVTFSCICTHNRLHIESKPFNCVLFDRRKNIIL